MNLKYRFTPEEILCQNKGLNVLRSFCKAKGQTPFLTAGHEALTNAARHGSKKNQQVVLWLKQTERYWICAVKQNHSIVVPKESLPFKGWSLIKRNCDKIRVFNRKKLLFLAVLKEKKVF